MIRDRGNIKWTAMMLPEHVKLLQEWKAQDENVEKPELDEWGLQDLNEQLQIAYANNLEVELSIWKEKRIFKVIGIITKLDTKSASLYLEDGQNFPFSAIFGVSLTV